MFTLLSVSIISLLAMSVRAANTTSSPAAVFSQITPSTNLAWHQCLGDFSCAVLDVPLDYKNKSGPRAYVPLLKVPATSIPYKGMVLTNPGGPGVGAIDDLLSENGAYKSSVLGSNYDFVAFEPRGLGYSMPATNCTGSITSIPGIQQRSERLRGPGLTNKFFNDAYQGAVEVGQVCKNLTGGYNDAGPHMSTLSLVQDMLSIVDAFASSTQSQGVKDASLVNFWGFSYGTYVAQTFASIHPDRVGRFVIDGVVDPEDYRSGDLLKNLQFSDRAFSTYFIYCHLAGPEICPYATGNSPHDIFKRFEATVKRLDVQKAERENWANASAISLALEGIKQFEFHLTYVPIAAFPALAPALLFLETASKNISMASIQELEQLMGGPIVIAGGALEATRAVGCSDNGNVLYGMTVEELSNVTGIMEQQSYVGGEFWASLRVACAGWDIGSDGRYNGKFGSKTKNPMLFVSNTLDPATPYFNGVSGTKLFPGSELVLIEGAGHTILGPQNKCANAKIQAFFQNGTLPGRHSFCPLEAGPFNITIGDALSERSDLELITDGVRGLNKRFGNRD